MYFEKEYTDGFFNVSGSHGFLPIKEPLAKLPSQYDALQHVINHLHVNQIDGILGIPNEIVKAVASIPSYLSVVEQENDVFILQALYRA